MRKQKTYKVESGIPIPPTRGRSPREGTSEMLETIFAMKVGESFIYNTYPREQKKKMLSDMGSIGSRLKQACLKRKIHIRITNRGLPGPDGSWTLRVWKVEHVKHKKA